MEKNVSILDKKCKKWYYRIIPYRYNKYILEEFKMEKLRVCEVKGNTMNPDEILQFCEGEESNMTKHVTMTGSDGNVICEFTIRGSVLSFEKEVATHVVVKCIELLLEAHYIWIKFNGFMFTRTCNVQAILEDCNQEEEKIA